MVPLSGDSILTNDVTMGSNDVSRVEDAEDSADESLQVQANDTTTMSANDVTNTTANDVINDTGDESLAVQIGDSVLDSTTS